MTNKIKNIQKLITLSPDMWNKIEQMQNEHGLLKPQDVIRHAIAFTYKKEHPEYVEAIKERKERKERSPEEKAREKLSIEEAKQKTKEEKAKAILEEKIENGARICRELRGKEKKDTNGNRKCVFNIYQFTNPKNASVGEKTIYLDDLTDNEIEEQYMNTITNEPAPADQVIATLVDLGLTDNEGNPL